MVGAITQLIVVLFNGGAVHVLLLSSSPSTSLAISSADGISDNISFGGVVGWDINDGRNEIADKGTDDEVVC